MFSELECPLPHINHGSVSKNKAVLGDDITVTCEAGYEISGATIIECYPNQTFGENIPSCQGSIIFYHNSI